MSEDCAKNGGEQLDAELSAVEDQAEELRSATGQEERDLEDDVVSTPISQKRREALGELVAKMAKRTQEAPTVEDLRNELEGNSQTLADTATTSIEFQPSLRSLVREMGPFRLEAAVKDTTRGVGAIVNASNAMQPGSISMMTTSDVRLLDGMDAGINKALWPLVGLRKVLKSIRGNAALLRGRIDDWGETQPTEPQDIPGPTNALPSEEDPIPKSKAAEEAEHIQQDLEEAERQKEMGDPVTGGMAQEEAACQQDAKDSTGASCCEGVADGQNTTKDGCNECLCPAKAAQEALPCAPDAKDSTGASCCDGVEAGQAAKKDGCNECICPVPQAVEKMSMDRLAWVAVARPIPAVASVRSSRRRHAAASRCFL